VLVNHARIELFSGSPGRDWYSFIARRLRRGFEFQTQIGLALVLVRPVTGKAIGGQVGQDVPREQDLVVRIQRGHQGKSAEQPRSSIHCGATQESFGIAVPEEVKEVFYAPRLERPTCQTRQKDVMTLYSPLGN
jgi:hypothetical protein